MTQDLFGATLSLGQEGLLLAVMLSIPPLAASALASLAVSVLQALTGVQDLTLPVLPRLVLVSGTLVVTAAWMGGHIHDFAVRALTAS